MSKDLSLALRLYTDSARFVAGLTQAESGTRRFVGGVKREFEVLKNAMGSVQGKLAQLGVGVGLVATAAQSARMDKGLTQIGQTAGTTRAEVENLRRELFRMSGETGQNVDDLKVGFNNAVQAGLNFKEALPVIDATNKAMAVTGATADQLTAGLTVAGQAYNFDLAKPQLALTLLDKMTVAGRQGNAELENLSSIFARVGVNASSAGMGFDQTLAFIETLSLVERQPERLATLADSTLRLFTNMKYMKDAAQATGVKFFDGKGERRDAVEILKDIKSKYDALKNDKSRAIFLQNAFGHADLDTIKGLKTLLGGDSLNKIGEFSTAIRNAGGTIERDLPAAIDNAIDATDRLKAELRLAADGFVKPINETYQNVVKWGLDKKENGGLGLDGKDLMIGGAVAAAGTFMAARYGGKAISGLAKRFGGTAAGVAEGKALEAAAGVTPVFVVNWPASMGGSIADVAGAAVGAGTAGKIAKVASRAKTLAVLAGGLDLATWGTMGAAGVGTAAAGVAAAGAGGYAVGSGLNWGAERLARGTRMEGFGTDVIGGAIAKILALLGNADAREAIALNKRADELLGKINIQVNDGRVTSVTASTNLPRLPMNVDAGRSMINP